MIEAVSDGSSGHDLMPAYFLSGSGANCYYGLDLRLIWDETDCVYWTESSYEDDSGFGCFDAVYVPRKSGQMS